MPDIVCPATEGLESVTLLVRILHMAAKLALISKIIDASAEVVSSLAIVPLQSARKGTYRDEDCQPAITPAQHMILHDIWILSCRMVTSAVIDDVASRCIPPTQAPLYGLVISLNLEPQRGERTFGQQPGMSAQERSLD